MPTFNDEEGQWVTINGNHIFIREGQSMKSAIQERFGKAKGGGGKIKNKVEEYKKEPTKPKFDKETWEKMDMQARRDAWEKMSQNERDEMTNARESIPTREKELLKSIGKWSNTGNLEHDIDDRIQKSAKQMSDHSNSLIKYNIGVYEDILEDAGLDTEKRATLMCMATDALIAQEMEAQNRQLGDHGMHHITGNMDRAFDIFSITPQAETPHQQAELMTAILFHDMGYLTEPSRVFLDEGHPRWGEQFFNEELYSEVSHVLGKESAINIGYLIRTHDGTDLDWDHDPVGSALRLSDNTALFEFDKLPPMFREVPENIDILEEVHLGNLDMETARAQMLININNKKNLKTSQKIRFNNAANEMTGYTVKTTLAMLGANISKMSWEHDHPVFTLVGNHKSTRHQKTLDLGQMQFAKFAKAYGLKPEKFRNSLNFSFKHPKTGLILLEGRYIPADEYNRDVEWSR